MKSIKKILIATIVVVTFFASSCFRQNDIAKDLTIDVVGTYNGTLTTSNLKALSNATVDVTKSGDNELEIHCYGDEIDTIIIQRLFEDGNMIQVCSTGNEFLNEYGHEMLNQSQHHDMMNDANGLSWAHHKEEEHSANDEHYGGFDIGNHTFSYTFEMKDNDLSYTRQFTGIKE